MNDEKCAELWGRQDENSNGKPSQKCFSGCLLWLEAAEESGGDLEKLSINIFA